MYIIILVVSILPNSDAYASIYAIPYMVTAHMSTTHARRTLTDRADLIAPILNTSRKDFRELAARTII